MFRLVFLRLVTYVFALVLFPFLFHDAAVWLFEFAFPDVVDLVTFAIFLVQVFRFFLHLLGLLQSFWSRLQFVFDHDCIFFTPVAFVLIFCRSTLFIPSLSSISCISAEQNALATNGSYCRELRTENVHRRDIVQGSSCIGWLCYIMFFPIGEKHEVAPCTVPVAWHFAFRIRWTSQAAEEADACKIPPRFCKQRSELSLTRRNWT